jgi:hypothetical protein
LSCRRDSHRISRPGAPLRPGATIHDRGSRMADEDEGRRRQVLRDWQLANMLYSVSALSAIVCGTLLIAYFVGLFVDLGLSTTVSSTWLALAMASWFGTLIIGIFVISASHEVAGRRSLWICGAVFPLSTIPAAIVFGVMRRRQLHDEAAAFGAPMPRKWWQF